MLSSGPTRYDCATSSGLDAVPGTWWEKTTPPSLTAHKAQLLGSLGVGEGGVYPPARAPAFPGTRPDPLQYDALLGGKLSEGSESSIRSVLLSHISHMPPFWCQDSTSFFCAANKFPCSARAGAAAICFWPNHADWKTLMTQFNTRTTSMTTSSSAF